MGARYDVAVAGGGLAGMIAALAMADKGLKTVLIAPEAGLQDGRTTALMDQSIGLLERLGLWEKVRPYSAALSTMQIIDGTERLLRAPTVAFKCTEIGLDAFGYNIPNAPFLSILEEAIKAHPGIELCRTTVAEAVIGAEGAELVLATGDVIEARLVIGADGRKSKIREAAGISVRTWSYPQTALVLNFAHSLPHGNVSTEFHTPSGPFTQVPLPGNNSSLVWVLRPEDALRMASLEPAELGMKIESRMQSMLGKVTVTGKPQTWPLSGMTASRFGKASAILVGEAGHVFPPIGAQGLNLSLRDIMTAAELIGEDLGTGGNLAIGDRFDSRRRADILARTASVDLLNRSLLSGFLPVQILRAAGLSLLAGLSPLRNAVMQEGIEPGRATRNLPRRLREKISR